MAQFTKVKTTHHILKDFTMFLKSIELIEDIQRIIPGRIVREQSGRSGLRINFSYQTRSGLKYKLIKGSTAQELFIVCKNSQEASVLKAIEDILKEQGWK